MAPNIIWGFEESPNISFVSGNMGWGNAKCQYAGISLQIGFCSEGNISLSVYTGDIKEDRR